MAKYSKGAQKSVESSMKRMEKGKLESGKSGKKVTNPKQAIAIGLSEARKKGAKVPSKKTAAPKKSIAKKAIAPKKAAKKIAAKAPAKKSAPKKVAAKKVVAKKAAPKKTVAPKKAATKKSAPQKAPAKKSASKRSAPAKKVFADKNLNKKTAVANNNAETASMPEYDQTVGKVANIDTSTGNGTENNVDHIGMLDDGLKAPEKIEDPITAADTKAYNKATTKGDPHQKLHLSSAKGGIKPSGKKPLWNR